MLVDAADPGTITAADVDAVCSATGVDVRVALVDELKSAYDAFLASTIPPGDAPLAGDEASRIASFRDALGLTDEDAAPVHIDVGRRLSRDRAEAGSRAGAAAGRAALAKLIYVSSLVFGDQKAAFMLPWRRVFGLTDAQLYVAKRDCARALVRRFIADAGGLKADKGWLEGLEARRVEAKLPDDVAADEGRAAARAALEARLAPAVDPANAGAAGKAACVAAINDALAFSKTLASLADAPGCPPGLATPTVHGGKLEEGVAARSLRDAYKAWLDAALAGGAFLAAAQADASTLASALALGAKEATEIRTDAVRRAYRRALRAEVQSGRLDDAPSKAALLGDLCDRLAFDADAAAALHKDIYRQKADSVLEKGSLTGEAFGSECSRVAVARVSSYYLFRPSCAHNPSLLPPLSHRQGRRRPRPPAAPALHPGRRRGVGRARHGRPRVWRRARRRPGHPARRLFRPRRCDRRVRARRGAPGRGRGARGARGEGEENVPRLHLALAH
jgi:hypothetical protein